MKKSLFAILMAGLMSIPVLFADGDARPATQSEKDFTLKVLQTLDKTVPAPASGWVIESKSEITAPEWVTVDAEKYPLQVDYQQSWQHPEKLEEARIKEEKMITEMAASMQNDQKDMAEVTRRLDALSAEMAKAWEKNDAAEVSRIQGEMNELAQQINEVGEAQTKVIEAKEQEIKPKDAKVQFTFRVNAPNFDVSWYKKDMDIAGLQVYRREFDNPNASMEGEYVVFVGDFAPKTYESETWMELKVDPAVPSISVQSIILVVAGDKAHTRQLIESMDWTALKNLAEK